VIGKMIAMAKSAISKGIPITTRARTPQATLQMIR
jgi:hypothetical protein